MFMGLAHKILHKGELLLKQHYLGLGNAPKWNKILLTFHSTQQVSW